MKIRGDLLKWYNRAGLVNLNLFFSSGWSWLLRVKHGNGFEPVLVLANARIKRRKPYKELWYRFRGGRRADGQSTACLRPESTQSSLRKFR